MEHNAGVCHCDICEEPVEYHSLISSESNKVEWLFCGHVLITRDHVVVQTYNYAKVNNYAE